MKAFFLLDRSSLYTFQILVNKGSRTRNEADQIIWQRVDQDSGKILVQLHYLMDLAETWSLVLQLPHGNEYRVRSETQPLDPLGRLRVDANDPTPRLRQNAEREQTFHLLHWFRLAGFLQASDAQRSDVQKSRNQSSSHPSVRPYSPND